ncbi:hypothetical protein [Streptomyces sp. NPDC005507]|uniref:hypothetical protein n=1 Tax=Streptomyces sp. NPDC005507 TaxID=3154885 RepID=UPI0033AF308A
MTDLLWDMGSPIVSQLCACRERHPGSSSGMSVLVDDAAEPVMPAYVEAGDPVGVGDWFGDWP